MGESKLEQGNSFTPPITTGEEFIAWAEQYWRLEEKYTDSIKDPGEKGGEVCPYGVVKQAFSQHIDAIIESKLRNSGLSKY